MQWPSLVMGRCRGVDENRPGSPQCRMNVKYKSNYCWKHQYQDPGVTQCMGKKTNGMPCERNAMAGLLFCRSHRRQIADLEKLECPRGCGQLSYEIVNEMGYFECSKCKGSVLNAKNIGAILKDKSDKVGTLESLLEQGVPCDLDCPTCEGKMVEIRVFYELPKQQGGGGLGNLGGMSVDHPILLVFALVVVIGAAAHEASKDKNPKEGGKIGSLVLDGCGDCGSFWFDKGELDSIRRSVSVKEKDKKFRRINDKSVGTRSELKTAYCTYVDPVSDKKCRGISFRGGEFCWKHK